MPQPPDRPDYTTLLKDALREIRELRRERDALRRASVEPIAIVGMACRFPGGASSPDAYWQMLMEGRDAIGEVPEERWPLDLWYDPDPDAAGKTYSRWGGFIEGVESFDAEFFGIAPREAVDLDPQQRLLLELSWEALEAAGIRPDELAGSQTGVFVGLSTHDYELRTVASGDPLRIDAYSGTGSTASVAAGRIAYVLGLQGPCLALDTACSSSLVAVHLACQSLRNRESDLALAGGANLILSPEGTIFLSRLRALSPDGRCRAFSAAARGYVRSDGGGVVLLRRLDDALQHGEPIVAVIRGAAVNHDGSSNGLTAPNRSAQEAVMRAALDRAGVSPLEVGYVEAHGTGTPLGDPIEVQGLAAVYGAGRDAGRPLHIGAVKTNIGHTEAAAGVAGLIKTALAVKHGTIPGNLHAEPLNPLIDWSRLPIRVPGSTGAWPHSDGPRMAGVSSFGFSGTNAHVILEQAPTQPSPQEVPSQIHALPLLLSGHTEAHLRAQAGRWADWLESRPDADLSAMARTAALHRAAHKTRAVVVAASVHEVREALLALEEGRPSARAVEGTARQQGQVAFVFPGQGSQWPGMGNTLLETSRAFSQAIDACDAALRPLTGWSVKAVLAGAQEAPGLETVDVIQPVLFAMSIGLAALWRSLGVAPDFVVGHSQGEITAAVVSGALSMAEGARVIAVRSRLVARLAGSGAMGSIELPVEQVEALLKKRDASLSVAVVNGPASTVVAGKPAALEVFLAELSSQGVFARRVSVDYASHCSHVDPLLSELREALTELRPQTGVVPLISTVTGEDTSILTLDANYWCRNLREPVRLDRTLASLTNRGTTVYVEISPHPVLSSALSAATEAQRGVFVGSLKRDEGGIDRLLLNLGQLWAAGRTVDWAHLLGQGPLADLPTTAFIRQRFWLEPPSKTRDLSASGLSSAQHPLLGAKTILADGDGVLFTGRLSLKDQPWLADHQVFDTVILPGTGLLELALVAAREVGCAQVSELTLAAPLSLPQKDNVLLQLRVEAPDASGARTFSFHCRLEDAPADIPWTLHAFGTLSVNATQHPDVASSLTSWPPAGSAPVNMAGLYPRLAALRCQYGPSFQGLREVRRRGETLFARVVLPESLHQQAEAFLLHPALLDAALHALAAVENPDGEQVDLPFSWADVSLSATGARELWVQLEPTRTNQHERAVRLHVLDASGQPVADIGTLHTRPATLVQLRSAIQSGTRDLYTLAWNPVTWPEAAQPLQAWVLGGDGTLAGQLGVRRFDGLEALLAALEDERPERLLLDATGIRDDGQPVPLQVRAATAEALSTLQRLLAEPRLEQTPLVLVTRGAVSTGPDEGVTDLAHAPLWGLLRSARGEHPDRVLRCVDLDSGPPYPAGLMVDAEPELALRAGTLLTPRLLSANRAPELLSLPPGTPTCRIASKSDGTLSGIELVPCEAESCSLRPGEVRVEVAALGLNFLDVVRTLGLVSLTDRSWLAEAAGSVLEVGPGVLNVRPGQRVMGLLSTHGGSFAIADHRLLSPIPDRLTFPQAASIPVNFLTSLYALQELASLRKGQRILVHAAAGGTGMAAVQIARHFGAEVFGTASPTKWHALRALGLDDTHLASSRDLHFAQEFLTRTHGAGMDVVLNSLSREFVDASLKLLPVGGRFLELGKTDIRDSEIVARNLPGVVYRAFDLMEAGPERLQAMLLQLAGLFAAGVLQPLPLTAYDLRQAPLAFKRLAQGRNIGKLVLLPPRPRTREGTVLLTGGTGELGQALARHLVERHGVQHLLLTSRQGMDAPGAGELVVTLRRAGAATVTVAACDVADATQLATLLGAIPSEHPLKAVFHLAGVLDDGLLATLTLERLEQVLRPKVNGAWNLHRLTQGLALDAFVLFSSVAGVTGSPGQSNYAAANAFLDALAARRKADGLPGLSLAWGFWARQGQGLTAHLTPTDLARLKRQGISALTQEAGLGLLDSALTRPEPVLVPVRIDLELLQRSRQDRVVPALLKGLLRPWFRRVGAAAQPAHALRERLARLSEREREVSVLELVRQEVASVLALGDPNGVAPDQPLKALGLDSLMAVELRNRLAARADASLPATLVFDYPTPRDIAATIAQQLTTDLTSGGALASGPESDSPVHNVGLDHTSEPGVMPGAETASPLLPRTAAASPGQMRLWFLQQILDRPETYNVHVAVVLEERLDATPLRRALELLVARHEQLRLHFVEQDGALLQRILPWVEIDVPSIDLSALSPEQQEQAIRAESAAHAQTPFDLRKPPLLRLTLVQLSPGKSALLLTWHHIATDAWSLGVFFNELLTSYRALLRGQTPRPLTAPSYLANTRTHLEWLKTPEAAKERRWWRAELEGLSPLQLPIRGVPPSTPTRQGAHFPFALPGALSQAIDARARDAGCTPFVFLFGAWSALLHRYSRQDDFAVGTTTSGRINPGLEGAIGLYVNTLPVRCDLRNTPTVREHLGRLSQRVTGLLGHQRIPLDDVVLEAGHRDTRDPGFSPLFNVCMVLEEQRWFEAHGDATLIRLLGGPISGDVEDTAKFDLSLAMVRLTPGYQGSIEFRTELFSLEFIERVAGHFQRMLEGMVLDLERTLSDIPLLTEAERHRVLVEWNDTSVAYPESPLPLLFEAQVKRTPDAVALVFEGAQLTYAELNARANRLAHHLRTLGVGQDVLVAICLERSLEMVVALLAVLKAGGAYVPLDPVYPPERLRFMLEDSAARVVLTASHLAGRVAGIERPCLCLDRMLEQLLALPADNPMVPLSPENLAYVIYTSGSTGRPKGALVPHAGLANYLHSCASAYPLVPGRSVPVHTSMAFDLTVTSLLYPLAQGCTVRLLSENDGVNALAQAVIDGSDFCLIKLTPAHLELLAQQLAFAPGPWPARLPEHLVVGGEALTSAHLAWWRTHAPRTLVHNEYGPTETTVGCCVLSIPAGQVPEGALPIGRPLQNTRLYVLDAALEPVPIGIPGELFIGGAQVARGYLNRPALTAERFLPDPFSAEPGARMYRTGDLCRYREDGNLEFLGRIDHQVKLRGFRIELGEIESALTALPEVAQAVVLAREDIPGAGRLVAYLVPRDGATLEPSRLRQALQAFLPEYMLPSAWVILEVFPLTPNGKLDRKALPAPSADFRPARDFVAPRSPLEITLAGIIGRVLGLERVGVRDNFFEIGGHSLALLRIRHELEQALDRKIAVADFFQHPTIDAIARVLENDTGSQQEPHRASAVQARSARALAGASGLRERARASRHPTSHGPSSLTTTGQSSRTGNIDPRPPEDIASSRDEKE